MSQAILQSSPAFPRICTGASGQTVFAGVCLCIILAASLLAGWAPIGFSIVTVFLFAGPHNWIEFRYFLSKMPAHWGPLRGFFLIAIAGVITLASLFAVYPAIGRRMEWETPAWLMASSVWNSLFVLWVAALVWMRGRQSPRRDWSAAFPIAFALIAFVWIYPRAWDFGLVYLHPLIALVFLDREFARRRPDWRRTYHVCLLTLPIMLAVLWWRLADAPPLAGGNDMLTMRITRHAGAGILQNVSPHLLVSTHTFLEMIHYGVWVVAIPLLAMRTAPWTLTSVPLFRRSAPWRRIVIATVILGALVVVGLWASFLGNYAMTRDVYFTVAIAHVLAEFPFLLRTL